MLVWRRQSRGSRLFVLGCVAAEAAKWKWKCNVPTQPHTKKVVPRAKCARAHARSLAHSINYANPNETLIACCVRCTRVVSAIRCCGFFIKPVIAVEYANRICRLSSSVACVINNHDMISALERQLRRGTQTNRQNVFCCALH